MRCTTLILLACGLVSFAADKPKLPAMAGAENDRVELSATLVLDPAEIKTLLGSELPPGIVLVEIKAIPKGDDPLSIGRDDFTLISHRDGQRSGPYAPTQLAGKDVLVVSQQSNGGTQSRGPTWSGLPVSIGRSKQAPAAGATPPEQEKEATVQRDTDKEKSNPLLDALEAKVLPDSKETKDEIAGYLFFPLEGKQKVKDLELIYKGPGGRLMMPFRQ
jgi:hypothetical protein